MAARCLLCGSEDGIRATRRPFAAYTKRPGETIGDHWYVPNVRRTAQFQHVLIDTNFWKSFVHDGLAAAPSDRGCIGLYGTARTDHGLFAEHLARSERWVEVTGPTEPSASGPSCPPRPTTTGWTAWWAAPRRPAWPGSGRPARPCRCASENTTRRKTSSGDNHDHDQDLHPARQPTFAHRPQRPGRPPRAGPRGQARPGMSPGMSLLRLQAFSSNLHARRLGRPNYPPAGMPTLREAPDNLGKVSMGIRETFERHSNAM